MKCEFKKTIQGCGKTCDEYIGELVAAALPRKEKDRPCAVFHYISFLKERINDIVLIANRMDANRRRLKLLDKKLQDVRIKNGDGSLGDPLPKYVQSIMRQQDLISKELRLDFEVLYVWGMILLDQWALVVKCVCGVKIEKRHPFNEIMEIMEAAKGGVLQGVWVKHKTRILWLFHNFRVFRNTFVSHAVQTWQRGYTRGIGTMDFQLFIPAPPKHRTDENQFRTKICSLVKSAPKSMELVLKNEIERFGAGKVLETMMDKIGDFPRKEDRVLVERLYKQFGGSTPTYQTVVGRLMEFCEGGLKSAVETIKHHPELLDFEYVDTEKRRP